MLLVCQQQKNPLLIKYPDVHVGGAHARSRTHVWRRLTNSS